MNERLVVLLQSLNDIGVRTRTQGGIAKQINCKDYCGVAIITAFESRKFEIRWYPEENILTLYIVNTIKVSHSFMKHLIELQKIIDDYNNQTEQAEESHFSD